MEPRDQALDEFAIKDCALVAIATGRRAGNLRELRDLLQNIESASIYHHFGGALLHSRFIDREFNNDFAGWAHHALHDNALAERLAVIDPTNFETLEGLRQELIDVIEERLDEREVVSWAHPDEQFHFIRSQIVVFDTHQRIATPNQLPRVLSTLSTGSIFYHFIDARRRSPEALDDFRVWLQKGSPKFDDLCADLADIDPFFQSLSDLRARLVTLLKNYFGGESP